VTHCLPCGTEMRFVRVVPYQAMVKTRELHLFECPTCKRTERRLVSSHNIGPFLSERMELAATASLPFPPAMVRLTVIGRNGWTRLVRVFRDAVFSASALLRSAQDKVPVAAQKARARNKALLSGSLPSAAAQILTSARQNLSLAEDKMSAAARTAWLRAVATVRGGAKRSL
jgi:hypothetical protein